MSNSGLDTSKEVSKAARKEFYEKNANNLKLLAMFVISFAVLTAATGGRFSRPGR